MYFFNTKYKTSSLKTLKNTNIMKNQEIKPNNKEIQYTLKGI